MAEPRAEAPRAHREVGWKPTHVADRSGEELRRGAGRRKRAGRGGSPAEGGGRKSRVPAGADLARVGDRPHRPRASGGRGNRSTPPLPAQPIVRGISRGGAGGGAECQQATLTESA